jgi:hypothetical protein
MPVRDRVALFLFLAFAALVRVSVAGGDLWLDEIWSLSFARGVTWPWEIVTGIHHDNNHPLNTFAMFVVVKTAGAHAAPILYRLLSILTGVATIAVLFWTEQRVRTEGGQLRAWTAAILCGCSFLAVVYSSEARGYAPAAFFAVVAFAMVRHRALTSGAERVAFALVFTAGLLSHLTFLFVYAGLAAWTFSRFVGNGRGDWRRWVALHQVPVAIAAGIYLIDARQLVYGGGPPFRVLDVIGRTLALSVGGPDWGLWQFVAIAAAAGAMTHGFWLVIRERNDEGVFFATSLVLAPAAVLFLYQPRFLDVRYFFVLVPFAWLLATRALGRIASYGFGGRAVAAALLATAVAGNIVRLASTLPDGRGRYREAVTTMANLSSARDITVASDHDFSNRLILDYYGEALPPGKKLIYVPSPRAASGGAEWFVTHTFEPPRAFVPPQTQIAAGGTSYVLVRSFVYGGISGWNWHLYRRKDLVPERQERTRRRAPATLIASSVVSPESLGVPRRLP